MDSKGWVEERMVQNVAVEEEGERWVMDLLEADDEQENGDLDEEGQDWEVRDGKLIGGMKEGNHQGRRGEWRRRRWVRIVKRKAMRGDGNGVSE